MKFTFLETTEKEEVVVYAKEKTSLITKIESLCKDDCNSLIGYFNDVIKELDIDEVECFITNKDKVFAIANKEVYLIKKRLYELSNLYPDKFTFINQSCLANLKKVDHFTVSIGGALQVIFKSGYKDFVSRRQLKHVKERIGIK